MPGLGAASRTGPQHTRTQEKTTTSLFFFFFERMSPARWGPPGMGAPRHGPLEMSFLRKRNEKVNEQKIPCLDAKMT